MSRTKYVHNKNHIYKRGNGFRVMYKGKSKRCKTMEEANEALLSFQLKEKEERELNNIKGTVKTPNKYSFKEMAEMNVKYVENNRRYSTYRKKKQLTDMYIIPNMRDISFTEITIEDCEEFREKIRKLNLSSTSKNTILTEFRAIFTYARKKKGIYNGSAEGLERIEPTDEEKRIKLENEDKNYWEPKMFDKFLECVYEQKFKLLFTVCIVSSVRLGELIALQWKDYDGVELHVYKSHNKETNEIGLTKSGKGRYVSIPQNVCEALNSYKESEMKKPNFSDEWFIFNRWDGVKYVDGFAPIPRNTITRRKDKACKLSGVRRIRIHDLRHSGATIELSKGADLKAVSKRLGHANTLITQNIYQHVTKEENDEILEIASEFAGKITK